MKIEKWDVEEVHIKSLFITHTKDFFIAYHKESLVGFIIALRESEKFGMISSFLILKEFRGLGFGKQLFIHALHHLQKRQIALDSIESQQDFYNKFAFQSYFDVTTYKFIKGTLLHSTSNYTIEPFATTTSLQHQSDYMQLMISSFKDSYLCIKEREKITSFGFLYRFRDGYKIYIHSENIDEAITLFFELTQSFKERTPVYLQTSKLEPLQYNMVKRLKMRETSKFIRMYNKIL